MVAGNRVVVAEKRGRGVVREEEQGLGECGRGTGEEEQGSW